MIAIRKDSVRCGSVRCKAGRKRMSSVRQLRLRTTSGCGWSIALNVSGLCAEGETSQMWIPRNNIGKIRELDPEDVLHGKEFNSSFFVHSDKGPNIRCQRSWLFGLGQHATCDTPD